MLLAILSLMPFMVCLFWCVIFLIEYRTMTKAQHVLLSFLGISTALYFCHGLFFMGHGELVALSDIVYSFCNIAVFPVFYLYIRRLTVAGTLPPKCYLALVPAVAICVWTSVIYALGGDDVIPRQQIRMAVGQIVFILQLLLVSYYGAKRLRQFDRTIDDFYSNKENRELRLFGIITFVMLACALVSTVVSSVGRDFFSQNEAMLALPSCIFSAVLFTIAYVGYKQKFDADALEQDMSEYDVEETTDVIPLSRFVEPKVITKSEGLVREESSAVETEGKVEANSEEDVPKTEDEDTENPTEITPESNELLEDTSLLGERIKQLIEKEHIYLDSNLKLTDVATRLHIGRSTLSAFINQKMGVSFSDFINAKRIDHAKSLIKAEPTLSLIEVSERSGFASPSSFYRAFKKYVGVTPKDWVAKGN